MAMAAGGGGGGVLKHSLGGGTKDTPSRYPLLKQAPQGDRTPSMRPKKKGVTYLVMTAE